MCDFYVNYQIVLYRALKLSNTGMFAKGLDSDGAFNAFYVVYFITNESSVYYLASGANSATA